MRLLSTGFWSLPAKLRLALISLLALVVLATVPLMPWRPACRCSTVWSGNLRDIYVDQVVKFLKQENVYYWRFGDVVMIRVLPWLDGNELWARDEIIYDAECKLAESLSEDRTINGIVYPAPEAVKRLKVELEPIIGPDPRIKADGTRIHGSDPRVRFHCALFRAAILEPPAAPSRR